MWRREWVMHSIPYALPSGMRRRRLGARAIRLHGDVATER